VIRPERAVLTGESGFIVSLEKALKEAKLSHTRAEIRKAIDSGAATIAAILEGLVPTNAVNHNQGGGAKTGKLPTVILAIDQAEELFRAEGADEARIFLDLLRELIIRDHPELIALFTIRSDSYERLQTCDGLQGLRQHTLSLPPMPKGAYAEVIKGPARRLDGTKRALKIEEPLVDALLADIEEGSAKDALPLLAFTLEWLYREYGGDGDLRLSEYEEFGRVKGSIEAAVERALKAADADPKISGDRKARLAMLRRALIPWMADLDPDTGSPRRRIARQSEIPFESRPLVDLLVDQRLLATDFKLGEMTIEPVHEALLRQWSLLQGWLAEDAGQLNVIESVKRASRDWMKNEKAPAWLTHSGERLNDAERLTERGDLGANLGAADREYVRACHQADRKANSRKRLVQALVGVLVGGIVVGSLGWLNQSYLRERWRSFSQIRPFMLAEIRPYVLTEEAEGVLKPGDTFRECAKHCPEMVVVPAGTFNMGSPDNEKGHDKNESPQHAVTFGKPFAVSKFEVTFDEWDSCVRYGDCEANVSDSGWGRMRRPVINVTWYNAQRYVAWLSKMTGKSYRLLSESEWEYSARAGTRTAYSWGDDIGKGNANCKGCGSHWDSVGTAPAGSFNGNAFGLYDMHGNVWEWVEDCFHDNYIGAPANGSPWITGSDCNYRVVRGGSWSYDPEILRAALRDRDAAGNRYGSLGFRVGRTLVTNTDAIVQAIQN
jgi:formylglycine-generating enzyme required for sulfatase activity